jgi:hypothetical protein
LRQVRQATEAGAIDFAVFFVFVAFRLACIGCESVNCGRLQANAAGSAGAIDVAVFICCSCHSACLVRLRVSQLRQVRQVWQAIAAGLAGAIDFAVFVFVAFRLTAVAAGKYILAVASFAAYQSVPLSAAANQSITAGKSILSVTSFTENQSIAAVHHLRQVRQLRWFHPLRSGCIICGKSVGSAMCGGESINCCSTSFAAIRSIAAVHHLWRFEQLRRYIICGVSSLQWVIQLRLLYKTENKNKCSCCGGVRS